MGSRRSAHGKATIAVLLALAAAGAVIYLSNVRQQPSGVVAASAAVAPAPVAAPVDAAPVEVPPEPAPRWPHPGDAIASFERVVTECPQRLLAMNFGERLLAIDASPASLDFIVEYESKPNRFVRLSCRWAGDAWSDVVVGRQTVPPIVGDAEKLPAVLLAPQGYDVAWYRERIAAARQVVGDTAELVRVETAFADGRVSTRLRFDGGRVVILGADDEVLPDASPFPQVERVRIVAPQARDLGFRDVPRINWATAFTSRLDQLGAKYVGAEEPILKLHATPGYVVITVPRPDFPGEFRDKSIDEYGDLTIREASLWGSECRRPLSLEKVRRRLDAAIAARRQTRDQFDETKFEVINLTCPEGDAPRFSFD